MGETLACESCERPITDTETVGSDDDGNYYCEACVIEFHRHHELCGLCESEGVLHGDSTCPLCDGAGYVKKEGDDE